MRRLERARAEAPGAEYDSTGEELQDVASGRNPATPAWTLLLVVAAVGTLFAIAIALVAAAYYLA